MKAEAKELAKGWGVWLAIGFLTVDDRHNRDLGDTLSLVLFALVTLAVVGSTVRFLYRLARVLYRLASARGRTKGGTTA